LGLAPDKTAYLTRELRRHFADSWVTGYEPLIERMTNDPHDRHVLAAAVKAGAQTIVTYNVRHFPPIAVAPWQVEVSAPGSFLTRLYKKDPAAVVDVLRAQASNLGRSLPEQLRVLNQAVRPFVDSLCHDLGIELR
jgi:hypothetical protein